MPELERCLEFIKLNENLSTNSVKRENLFFRYFWVRNPNYMLYTIKKNAND
jgi:hypothetical protein